MFNLFSKKEIKEQQQLPQEIPIRPGEFVPVFNTSPPSPTPSGLTLGGLGGASFGVFSSSTTPRPSPIPAIRPSLIPVIECLHRDEIDKALKLLIIRQMLEKGLIK